MSDVVEKLAALRIVPVLTASDADEAEHACHALLAGGLSVVEITFRTDAAAEAIRRVSGIDRLLVGAGAIVSPESSLGRSTAVRASPSRRGRTTQWSRPRARWRPLPPRYRDAI